MQVSLVAGITGQDGSYLADFLLSKGYPIIGKRRRSNKMDFHEQDLPKIAFKTIVKMMVEDADLKALERSDVWRIVF